MKNSGLLWIFVVGVVVTVLFAFNYQGGKKTVPLSEIFPDEETYPIDFEFVSDETQKQQEVQEPKAKEQKIAATAEIQKEAETIAETKTPDRAIAEQLMAVTSEKVPFAIQVASFQKKEKAQELINTLDKKNVSAYIVSRDLGEKGTWYRVYVGKFQTKTQAESTLNDLKKDYANSFIIAH